MASRLKELYETKIRAELKKQLGYKNDMQLPKLEKIVLNMGVGEAATDKKKLEAAVKDMTAIAGQKVVITKAKKSLANFKLKEGMQIGCKVTLRRGPCTGSRSRPGPSRPGCSRPSRRARLP